MDFRRKIKLLERDNARLRQIEEGASKTIASYEGRLDEGRRTTAMLSSATYEAGIRGHAMHDALKRLHEHATGGPRLLDALVYGGALVAFLALTVGKVIASGSVPHWIGLVGLAFVAMLDARERFLKRVPKELEELVGEALEADAGAMVRKELERMHARELELNSALGGCMITLEEGKLGLPLTFNDDPKGPYALHLPAWDITIRGTEPIECVLTANKVRLAKLEGEEITEVTVEGPAPGTPELELVEEGPELCVECGTELAGEGEEITSRSGGVAGVLICGDCVENETSS